MHCAHYPHNIIPIARYLCCSCASCSTALRKYCKSLWEHTAQVQSLQSTFWIQSYHVGAVRASPLQLSEYPVQSHERHAVWRVLCIFAILTLSEADFAARHCDQWGLYGVRVRQCLNRRSYGLGWCVRWAEALLY